MLLTKKATPVFIALSVAIHISGCATDASRQKALSDATSEKARIETVAYDGSAMRTITLAPILPPPKLWTDNRSAPVVGMFWIGLYNTVADKENTKQFSSTYENARLALGDKLTSAMKSSLEARSYKVKLANVSQISRDQAGVLQLTPFAKDALLLQLAITDAGMFSGRLALDYIPKFNTTMWLTNPARANDVIYNNYTYYGGHASGNLNESIAADPRHKFANFPALIAQESLVVDAFDAAISASAQRLVDEFSKQYPAQKASAK